MPQAILMKTEHQDAQGRQAALPAWLFIAVLLMGTALSLRAEQPVLVPVYSTETVLQGHALQGVHGATGINMAAGDNNVQSNAAAISVGDYAISINNILQLTTTSGRAPDKARVAIEDHAFSNSSGWMAVNQSAGGGNAQANNMGIALGIDGRTLTDTNLGQVVSQRRSLTAGPDGTGSEPVREVEIEESAFDGSRGVIQVNQSAGTSNATSNSFELRMGAGVTAAR